MHEFWRGMGLWADLVMINDYGNDYDQPVRDALRDMAAASHLRDLGGKNGGLHLLEGSALQTEQRLLLRAASALCLSGKGEEFVPQLRTKLQDVEPLERDQWQAMRQAPGEALGELRRAGFNGWGGFLDGGNSYGIDLKPGPSHPGAPGANPAHRRRTERLGFRARRRLCLVEKQQVLPNYPIHQRPALGGLWGTGMAGGRGARRTDSDFSIPSGQGCPYPGHEPV